MKYLALATVVATIGCGGTNNGNSDGGTGCATFADGGACFNAASQTAVRTQCGDVTEYCDTSGNVVPNLGCLTAPSTTRPSTPAKVTLTGFVHVFSSGPDSNNVTVQVFDAASLASGLDPGNGVQTIGTLKATLDPATQRACDVDGTKGCSIPLSTGCTLPVCNDGQNGHQDDHKYCRDNGAGGECSERLRWESRYAIPNVPTNKQLVIRVSGPNGASDATWATTVAFNVFLSTSDRACTSKSDTDCLDTTDAANPKYQLNASSLSKADYVNIPTISGLSGGVTAGQGAVAGEVHDCDNFRVANVSVLTTPSADRFTYFNGNPVKTLPDASRASVGTDKLGLFAALNVKPGKVKIEAAGAAAAAGPLVSFGAFDAFVYANTVSIVNVNGGKGTR
ncbi:MAG: hypothetical protein JWN44_517 [Myxococcales bacterium]|nr:hypothetical protein [Myxococcales bacterium]